jgi:hypothetical protein
LYSADLSQSQELAKDIARISPSGDTVSEWSRDSWKIYRLTDTLEPIREGYGDLQSLSDELLVIQDGKTVRTDFDGKVYREIHPKDLYKQGSTRFTDASVCAQGNKSSSDGRRILFDFATRKVPKLQHILESIQTISTLGMTGPEDVNGEEVRVMDTVNGKLCFDWHRSFPSMNWLVQSAAISPSGESVAIAAGDKLLIYRLPAVCSS